ncbi:MAG: hypothetical protein J0H83_11450 [Candidatus Melainabacteria bacterium]|nr:hypothetical protein [Candidatus Melainabacteria bacterium]
MVAINPEMLRELLAEFTEKEAVNREEINVINQQLEELDKRIDANKKKLEGLSRDREKILAMKERYLSGNWPNVSRAAMAQAASNAPVAPVSRVEPAPAPVAQVAQVAPDLSAAPAPVPAPVVPAQAPAQAPAQLSAPAPVAFDHPESTATSTATDLPASASPSITIPARTHNRLQAMPPVEAYTAPEPAQAAPDPLPAPIQSAAPQPTQPTHTNPAFGQAPVQNAVDLDAVDDPILSSFGGQPQAEVDIDSALSEPIEESNDQADSNNDFAWTSTAKDLGHQEDSPAQHQAAAIEPQGWGSPTAANPWGPSPSPVEFQAQQASPNPTHAPVTMPEPQLAQQVETPAPQSGPDYGGSNPWGDFGDEEWGQPAAAAEPQPIESAWGQSTNASTASGGGWGQSSQSDSWAAAAASQPQSNNAQEGGWGQPVSSQPVPQTQYQDTNQSHNPWGQPAPQEQASSMQQAWGQPAQAAAQPSHLNNPWGGGGDAQQASQGQTQDPAAAANMPQEQETRSSLARAADGALISPVKGRRKSGPGPAFDWGSDEQQQ